MFRLQKITKSKIVCRLIALAVLIILILILTTGLTNQRSVKIQRTLNQEDLALLVKPAVVRIVQHATGQAVIPAFDFDLKNLTIKLLPNQPAKTQVVDQYISGSGFIVNPSGFILTNAHVISSETVKELYLGKALEEKVDQSNQEELKSLLEDERALVLFAKNALDVLKTKSEFNIKAMLTVLNPSEPQEYLNALLKTGFPAEIVSINESFLTDDKDLGLIKINASSLPTLELGDSEQVNIGNKIYIFGFPSTAEFNQKSPLESTLTQGVVGAIKFSQNKDFKIFQTDAKISQGSSGGPLFNEKGQVVGLITFQTGQLQKYEGDSFAFAIPINLAKKVLENNHLANLPGDYNRHFKKGVELLSRQQCKKAISEFKTAVQTNSDFVGSKSLENYVKQCNQLIARGKSVDGSLKAAWVSVKSINRLTWFVVLGRLVLLILALWILIKLVKRIKKDEAQMAQLEMQIQEELDRRNKMLDKLQTKGLELPLPDQELHAASRRHLNIPHPHLIDFVKEAREIGLSDENIKQELKNCGWPEEEILQVLNL